MTATFGTALQRRRIVMAALAVTVGVTGIGIGVARTPDVAPPVVTTVAAEFRFARLAEPARTTVLDGNGTVVATLTDGARTVTLTGPQRTFAEPQFTPASVTTPVWVRLLPQEWREGDEMQPWFQDWLRAHLGSTEPDVLATATEYLDGAAPAVDGGNVRFAGDAGFGPPGPPGQAPLENSDFQDYLGVAWEYPDRDVEEPDPAHYGNVDCSGFVRLVYGYRHGYPLLGGNEPGPGLPRRAYAMSDLGPGAVVGGPTELTALQAGDLLFFNLDAEPQIDHSAIYLGADTDGHHRFVSSRGRADGPTLGDLGGTSLIDDGGTYSRAFRTAKRL